MGNVLFIVWRETLEAVLVIGILHSYVSKQASGARQGLRAVYGGVLAGIAMSLLLAVITLQVQNEIQGQALEIFQTSTLFVSAILMTQMVMWMNKNARKIKANLESEIKSAMTRSGYWGVATVAAIAVAREGAETVIYLYGLSLENTSGMGLFAAAAVLGFVLAMLTSWIVSKGIRFLDYKTFFNVTSIVLLLSAAGMLINGSSRVIDMGWLPPLINPVWNTSWILDGQSTLGQVLGSFTGYRARPSLMLVLIYAVYWVSALSWMKVSKRIQLSQTRAA